MISSLRWPGTRLKGPLSGSAMIFPGCCHHQQPCAPARLAVESDRLKMTRGGKNENELSADAAGFLRLTLSAR